jgi:hypothetical protein
VIPRLFSENQHCPIEHFQLHDLLRDRNIPGMMGAVQADGMSHRRVRNGRSYYG